MGPFDPGGQSSSLDVAVWTAQVRRENERLQRRLAQMEEQVRALLVLQGMANTIGAETDLAHLLRRVAVSAVRLASARVGVVYLVDATRNALLVEAVETEQSAADSGAFSALDVYTTPRSPLADESGSTGRTALPLSFGIAGHVAQTGELVLIAHARSDTRFSAEQVDQECSILGIAAGSLLVVPMLFDGDVTGVLEVAQPEQAEGFDARSLDFLRTLAAQGAVAITNARLFQGLRRERDRIIQTQEDERKRLARELHDGPVQKVSQIAMALEFAENLATREPDALIPELREIRETAMQTIHEIRNLLFDLRPLVLDAENGGLVAAIEHFLARFRIVPGPTFHLEAEVTSRFSHNVELTVFAIVQEAVNNILKHAGAQNCWITLRESPTHLLASVRDDGKGFDTQDVRHGYEQRGSWGMLTMHERAGLIEANLQIASQPGKGTIISLEVPRDR